MSQALERLSHAWNHIQSFLFPVLREELGELTEKQKLLVNVLEFANVEAHLPYTRGLPGRPAEDRAAKELDRGFPNIALGAIADGLARMRDTQGESMTYPEKLLRTIQDLHSVLHHMEKWQRARLAEAEHPEAIRRVQ